MRTEVMTAAVMVRTAGAQQFFSLDLPTDVLRITGVETGIRMTTKLTLATMQAAGTLRLQAAGRANMCFCSDVKAGLPVPERLTPGFAESIQLTDFNRWSAAPFVAAQPYEPELLQLAGCHTLYGCYSDELGKSLGRDLTYTVTFYIWLDIGTHKNKSG